MATTIVLSIPCGLTACACAQLDLMLIAIVTSLCSVNYWRRPEYGLRRTLDIGVANLAWCYSVYRVLSSTTCSAYERAAVLGLYTCAAAIWLQAVRLWTRRRESWLLWHVAFHSVVSCGNLALYLALAPKPS